MPDDPHSSLDALIAARRDLAIRLIQDLVRIPSHQGEGEVHNYIRRWWATRQVLIDSWQPDVNSLRAHPAFVPFEGDYTDRNNLVVTRKGEGGGRSLALNGHMDVVPADPGGTWSYGGPWSGALVGERIYGRGAVDMKAGLAIAMIVIDALLASGLRLKGDLQAHFVVDEENGGNGTLATILRGYRPDAVIFLEPTTPDFIVVSSRGAHFFRLTVTGVEGGIEYQFTQPNVIEKAFKLFQAVQAYALWRASQAAHPLYAHDPTKIPAAVCTIHAGNWPSTFAAQCVMEGSIECLPGEDIDQVAAQFEAYILESARQDPWLREHPPKVEWFGLRYEAGETPCDHPLVQQLEAAIQAVTGRQPHVVGGGGSDLRLPVLYANCPSVLFGPAGSPIHTADEYVEIDSVMQVAQALGRFILSWCEIAE